jgi:uncharacterized protein YjbI with pentapeptide repeats
MEQDYSNRILRKESFRDKDLRCALFYGSDLRGVDFSGCDLSGANFINVKTGITPSNTFLIFIGALAVSALSGYFAMLAGTAVQEMLVSKDVKVKLVGMVTVAMIIVFIVFSYWKGGRAAVTQLIFPLFFFSIIIGGISYFSGIGTGKGLVYELFALAMVIVMFFVGTIARATAARLSNVLFLIVTITGGVFGKTVGGGIGTIIVGISCALISKRALSGAKGFETLRQIASFFTMRFGTSFRNSKLVSADFSKTKKIRNADFSDADTSFIEWGNSKKINCIE